MGEATGRSWSEAGEHLISWRSWRGEPQFGWFAYTPPSWWPRRAKARFALVSVVAVGVKIRRGLFPPEVLGEGDVDQQLLANALRRPSGRASLRVAAPSGSGGTMSIGMAGDLTPEQEKVLDFLQTRGVEVDPAYWDSEDFPLTPVRHALPWTPDFEKGSTVAGLVGRGFPAYVRILHPVVETDDRGEVVRIRRWSEMPGVRLDEPGWRPDRLPDGDIDRSESRGWDQAEGEIPEQIRTVLDEFLCAELAERKASGNVVQAMWEGFGLNVECVTDQRIHQPERELIPFSGPFVGIVTFDDWRTPSLVFPEDGAWCLANDTDLVSTYLGCTDVLAERMFGDSRLECVRVNPHDQLG